MSSGNGEHFVVSFAGRAMHNLPELRTKALQNRCSERLRHSLAFAEVQLRSRPYEWGDPLFRMPNLQLLVFRGHADLIYVLYGVHDQKRQVFISDIFVDAFSPLGGSGYQL